MNCDCFTRVTSSACRHCRLGAFSLIELMIVVSIIAIVMATGVPKMLRTMQKEGLRKAESDLLEACGTARAQAIVSGIPMELVLKAEDNSITVQPPAGFAPHPSGGEENAETRSSSSAKVERFSAKLADGVAIRKMAVNFNTNVMDQAEARVRFFPNGTSDEFTILFFSSQGERMIQLDLVTGLAKLEVVR